MQVFDPCRSQANVFEDTKHLIQSAVDGYNVCIFAYGQVRPWQVWVPFPFHTRALLPHVLPVRPPLPSRAQGWHAPAAYIAVAVASERCARAQLSPAYDHAAMEEECLRSGGSRVLKVQRALSPWGMIFWESHVIAPLRAHACT